MTDYTQRTSQEDEKTAYSTWQSMPPQDTYDIDQPASTSASQPRSSAGWQAPSNTNHWGTNGPNAVSSFSGLDASSTNHAAQHPRANGITVNTQNLPITTPTVVQAVETESGKILCVADVRGNISQINELAEKTGAKAVIHSGDFGFYENSSLENISDRTLRHIVQYSNIASNVFQRTALEKTSSAELRRILRSSASMLSEFPLFLDGSKTLTVPVYTVWGACEDVRVLERFRAGIYKITNLHILDEANTYKVDIGNVCLRLFGLGGAFVSHKLFDCGEGETTIAGGLGTMWTTMLQIGELINTAAAAYDPTETRILITHASPGRDGLLTQLAIALRVDFTISAGLHFRYGISYNEFSVNRDIESWRMKLENSKKSFLEVYEQIKTEVESKLAPLQKELLDRALLMVHRIPAVDKDKEDPAFRNMWNFNLPDAAYGHVLLDVSAGRVSSEMKAQGFNFSYRRNQSQQGAAGGQRTTSSNAQPVSPNPMSPVVSRRTFNSPALQPQHTHGRAPSPSPSPLNHQRSVSPRPTHQLNEQSDPRQQASRSANAALSDATQRSTQEPPITLIPPKTTANIGGSISSALAGNAALNLGIISGAISSGVRPLPGTSAFSEHDGDSSQDTSNDAEESTVSSRNTMNINGNTNAQEPTWADQIASEYQSEFELRNYLNGDRGSDSSQSGQQVEDIETSSNMNGSQRDEQSPHRRQFPKFSLHVKGIEQDITEEQIRDFFGGDDSGVENVRFIIHENNDETVRRDYVYVDFVNEEKLEEALGKNQEVLGSTKLKIDKPRPRNERNQRGGGRRGRGRGRNGYNHSYGRGRGNHGN